MMNIEVYPSFLQAPSFSILKIRTILNYAACLLVIVSFDRKIKIKQVSCPSKPKCPTLTSLQSTRGSIRENILLFFFFYLCSHHYILDKKSRNIHHKKVPKKKKTICKYKILKDYRTGMRKAQVNLLILCISIEL